MNKIVFSVIIPIYNSSKYIEECILSVINKGFDNLEVLLINDGSTDNSKDICQKYADEHENITLVNKSNGGASSARNAGLELVKGDYILFLDSDDYYINDIFHELESKIKEFNSPEIIIYSMLLKKETTSAFHKLTLPDNFFINNKITKTETIYPILFGTSYLNNVTRLCIKKELAQQLKFDENLPYGQDYVFCVELFLKSNTILYCDRNFYLYRFNEESATKTYNKERFFNLKKTYIKISDVIDKHSNIHIYKNCIYVDFLKTSFDCLLQLYLYEKDRNVRRLYIKQILNDDLLNESKQIKYKNISKKNKMILFLLRNKLFLFLAFYIKKMKLSFRKGKK